jgi:uncharacterized FlgJ-related protein
MFKRNIIILLLWVNINPVFSENKTYIQLYPDSIQNIIYKDSTLDLNISNIYLKILEYNILEPKIVLYQALHESGNFKSKYFKINNNLFGFRGNNGYFKFKNWEKSVAYYKKWQDKVPYTSKKYGSYFNYLKIRNYATDPNYKLNVMRHAYGVKFDGTKASFK